MMPETVEEIRRISVRLDEHGRMIDENGKRITIMLDKQGKLINAVYGDAQLHHDGLISKQEETSIAVKSLCDNLREQEIRYQTTLTVAKIVLAILAATGVGVWWPILSGALSHVP